MKLIKIATIAATVAAIGVVGAVYINNTRINFTCAGAYDSQAIQQGVDITGKLNVVFSASRAKRIDTNLIGTITMNGKKFHLERTISWKYDMVNSKIGLLHMTPVFQTLSSTDDLKGTPVDTYVTGKDGQGRMLRLWKLNSDVMLMGNAYGPIFSCVLIR